MYLFIILMKKLLLLLSQLPQSSICKTLSQKPIIVLALRKIFKLTSCHYLLLEPLPLMQ